jgi:hypothetical protein
MLIKILLRFISFTRQISILVGITALLDNIPVLSHVWNIESGLIKSDEVTVA